MLVLIKGEINRNVFRFFLMIVALVSTVTIYADNIVPRITQLSVNDGLSNSRVTLLYQDSRGFLWIGTRDGFNRYDGYKFIEYKHNPHDSLSIAGNVIQSVIETNDGNLWIGTKDNGISVWDRKTDKFYNLNNLLPEDMKMSESDILGITKEKDNVWVLTPNFLIKVKQDFSFLKEFTHYNNVFKTENFSSYPLKIRNDKIWMGTKDGLLTFDTLTEKFSRFDIGGVFISDDISDLIFLNDSIIAVSSDSGLKKLNIKSRDFSIIWADDSPMGYVPVNCLAKSKNDVLWIGTHRGVERAKPPYSSHSVFGKDKKWGDKLRNVQIASLLFDKSGILWVGTKNRGVFKVVLSEPKFKSLSKDSDLPFSLDSYNFTAVITDKEGDLWLGTEDNGLYMVNKDFSYSKHFAVNRNLEYSFEDKVCALMENGGEIWIGTPSGIFILNKSTWLIREFDYGGSPEFANLLRHNRINDMLKDRLGDIWIATNFGLYKYDGEKIVSYFEDPDGYSATNSICSDVVNALYEDKQGWIWIGTKKGVNYLRRAGEDFQRICNWEQGSNELSDPDVTSFGESKNNIIWIGTRSGLSFYDKSKLKSSIYSSNNDNLAQTMVCSILIDGYDRLWMGTNKGIYYINADNKIFYFTQEDGLPGYSFNVRAAFRNKSNLYFGGIMGLAFLNTDSLKENVVVPNVVITDVEVLHKGKVIIRYPGEVSEIKFKYKKNSLIKVDFAALEFTQPKHNWYKIKLENFDDDWRQETHKNSVSFSNLSPGVYHLKILGANNDFVWNNDPAELTIYVRPPLWMSGFAYLFYILFGVFIIQLIINFSVRKYRVENKRLREEAENKHKIEEQKETLTKINRSLTDSISYAKRIQEAIIPSEQVFRKIIPEAFVYYGPKDIVSGDFYWAYEKNDKIFVAAIDCTGHGVPGAFMSMVGHGMLRNIVEIRGIECPADVLNYMNEEVISIFKKNSTSKNDGSVFEVNDGMDMVLCVIDKKTKEMEFAGAINPIYIIRDNEILTFKGDRFPVGHNSEKRFHKEVIKLMDGDMIYLFSDGYADQFGGPENKKFKYRRFRHLLLNIHKLPAQDQKAILHQKMEEWMGYSGKKQEQIDDILIIGIKPFV
ncbi:MAG: SpoIIE family protein phosphatase [Chlorobi bacterium]|nr:SpoIIE family protein phosphatase [Chlorobiota bacterium]